MVGRARARSKRLRQRRGPRSGPAADDIMGSDANYLDTAGLLEHPLSADAAASPPDRLLGSEPSEDNEEEEPRAGRADAGQAPMRAAGPDAGPDADA